MKTMRISGRRLIQASLIGVACFFGFEGWSQIDQVPGYLVPLQGDTIRGFIENRSLKSNANFCVFAASAKESPKIYYPGDIKAYGMDGLKYFQSISIKDNLGNSKRVFASIVLMSRASLYRYRKSTYMVHDSLGTQDLTFNGPQDLFGMNKSRGKMNFMFADCKTVRFPWDSIILNDEKIVELTRKYNSCKGVPILFKPGKVIRPVRSSFGLLIGFDASSYQFADFEATGTRATYRQTKFTGSNVPVFGGWYSLTFPRLSNAFSVYAEATYFSQTINGFASGTSITGNPETESVELKANYLRLGLGVKVLIPMRYITPFLKGGVSSYQASGFSGTRTHETLINSTLVSDVTHPWDNANLIGFWVGFGIERSLSDRLAISAEARYDTVTGFSGTNTGYPLNGSHTIFMLSLTKR
jgi:opacity protein-like surface antigen